MCFIRRNGWVQLSLCFSFYLISKINALPITGGSCENDILTQEFFGETENLHFSQVSGGAAAAGLWPPHRTAPVSAPLTRGCGPLSGEQHKST